MTNLIGVYECSVDAKGRLMLPVAFKKQLVSVLEAGFVMKRSVFNKCLELYPVSEWNDLLKDVNKLNRFVKKNADFIRMFNYGVKPVDLDGNARLLIPKDLMDFAGIEKNIVVAAAVNMIEIWDKEKYEAAINDPSIDFGSLAEEVMGGKKAEGTDGAVS
jgi:MraZ protein